MSILITDELKEQIKTQINIVEVIGQYVNLIQSGQIYVGLCPFHKENTPSFTVYPSGYKDNSYGCFYCYGCHAGNKEETNISNDVIGFIMAIEEVSFVDACKMLCDKYNIPYQEGKIDPEVKMLKEKFTAKNIQYHNYLLQNNLVLEYLRSRGVKSDSITEFRLGLVPGNEIPEWKRNRLVFAITDLNYDPVKSNTIAMGYRCLQGVIKTTDGMEYFPNSKPNAKYINDAENKIFVKRNNLYGLSIASKHIRKSNFAIVVEGYMDVILMHQTGFKNTVASMGTSFTDTQMDLLKKYTKQILFFLDADEAGLQSMQRILPKLLEKGFNVLVVEAPSKMDPADLCNKLGQNKSLMSNYINEHSTPALQWCTETALKIYDSKVYKARIDVLKGVLPILDKVKNRESRISYTANIANRLNIDSSLLIKDFNNISETEVFNHNINNISQQNNPQQNDKGLMLNTSLKELNKNINWK